MQLTKKIKRRFRKGKDITMIKFEYNGHIFESDDYSEVVDYAIEWSEKNWDDFVEWSDYLVTKDNYEQYMEAFLEETISE